MKDHFLKTMAGSLLGLLLFVLIAAIYEHVQHADEVSTATTSPKQELTQDESYECKQLNCPPGTICVVTKDWSGCR